MTAVFHSQRSSRQYSDNSKSDNYISDLQYVSDFDSEGYSGNIASSVNLDDDATCLRATEKHSPSTSRPKVRTARQGHDSGAQLSMVALVLATVRKSVLTCQAGQQVEFVKEDEKESAQETNQVNRKAKNKLEMEIGWPTDVEHVAHVTFDRYNGFLGLPEEYENEVPRPTPSASKNVFGVSAESMQCSMDTQGNMVPTILLLLQKRLYDQQGLKAEGIFRINPEACHEEHVREQLNKGIVPNDIDIHALAGLIKAWFRELPKGVLDALSPEQVLSCHGEKESYEIVKQLPPTEAALLDWAINLMADVVEEQAVNKMNARNVAMVFAPNMTQMADPLTALMHAVQVMNLLKTLVVRVLRARKAALLESRSPPSSPEMPETKESVIEHKTPLFVQPEDNRYNSNSNSNLFNRHDRQWSQTSSSGLLNGHDRTSSQCSQGGIWMGHDRSGSLSSHNLFSDRYSQSSQSPSFSSHNRYNSNGSQSALLNGHDRHSSHCEEPQVEFNPYIIFPPTHSQKGKGANGRLTSTIDQQSERVEAW